MLKLITKEYNKYPDHVKAEIDKALLEIKSLNHIKPICLTMSGSWSYGLARPDSDVDLRGIFCYPLNTYLGLSPYEDRIVLSGDDSEITDVRKLVNLASKGNAQALEIVFSEPIAVNNSDLFDQVINMRSDLLSSRTITASHIGFAIAELRKCQRAENQAKHRKHIVRLLLQAKKFLLNQVDSNFKNIDYNLLNVYQQYSDQEFEIAVNNLIKDLEETTPAIQKEVDYKIIDYKLSCLLRS